MFELRRHKPEASASVADLAPDEVVRAEGVHKFFGTFEVLRGIGCSIKRGEVVVIIGPSGAGKSTFLRCINGLEPFQQGEIAVGGYRLKDPKTDIHRVRSEVGMQFGGIVIHRELRNLEAAGLSPMEVIAAATGLAAQELDKADSLGTLQPGKLADMVVLNRDPLGDLGALRDIAHVIKGGEIVS